MGLDKQMKKKISRIGRAVIYIYRRTTLVFIIIPKRNVTFINTFPVVLQVHFRKSCNKKNRTNIQPNKTIISVAVPEITVSLLSEYFKMT